MKPTCDRVAIVTATVDPLKAADCFRSWLRHTVYHLPVYVVWTDLPPVGKQTEREARAHNAEATTVVLDSFAPGVHIVQHDTGGVVPAFALGVAAALADDADMVVCLHDDLLIEQPDWDLMVLHALDKGVKFAGFGGSPSLGSDQLYQVPYDPMQLARGGFYSNLRDAEAHGHRCKTPLPCVVFDGFCQIGTKDWFGDAWEKLVALGVLHHFYDGMLGCLATRAGVQPGLMLPVQCHHFGGRTAVGSPAYQQWARANRPGGDQDFWTEAHQKGYEEFRDVLPLRLDGRALRPRATETP